MVADQYVVVTRYAPPDGKEIVHAAGTEIVHVYGSWPTRARAETEARRMADLEREDGLDPHEVARYVRKVLTNPGEDAH